MDPDEALARFFQARAKAEEEARVAEPHFGAHRIVAEQLVRGNGEEEIGERVLKAYPPKEFNTTIDPDKVDPVAVGTDLVSDHVELGYGVDNR
jgi:hypothetical protein